jgi:hypothetical protein
LHSGLIHGLRALLRSSNLHHAGRQTVNRRQAQLSLNNNNKMGQNV